MKYIICKRDDLRLDYYSIKVTLDMVSLHGFVMYWIYIWLVLFKFYLQIMHNFYKLWLYIIITYVDS